MDKDLLTIPAFLRNKENLADELGEAHLQFVYEKLDGGAAGTIRVRFYAQAEDGLVLWKSSELVLLESDTVTLTGITVLPKT